MELQDKMYGATFVQYEENAWSHKMEMYGVACYMLKCMMLQGEVLREGNVWLYGLKLYGTSSR